jgi:hypothetical protein
MAAVIIHGLVSVADTVQTRATLYDITRQQYTMAIDEADAVPIPEMDEAVGASELGKQLSTIMNTGYSPLKTNVLSLKIGVKDRILIARNTQDEDAVLDIINSAILIDRPEGNVRLQGDLFQSFVRRRSFLLRNVNKTRAPAVNSGSRASPEYIAQLSLGIVEVSTSASRSNSRIKPSAPEPKRIDTPVVIVTTPAALKPKQMKPFKPKEEPMLPTYLSSEAVVREVGDLIFTAPEGSDLTAKEIVKYLKISPSDTKKVNSVLVAMRNAGYLGLTTREDTFTFTRTDSPKPQPKTS